MPPKSHSRALRRQEEQRRQEERALLAEYNAALARLRDARASFQQVTDPALISACIYEVNAAQTHCSFLLARLRETEARQDFVLR